jgi:DNA-binding transcriptional LysR family regulator
MDRSRPSTPHRRVSHGQSVKLSLEFATLGKLEKMNAETPLFPHISPSSQSDTRHNFRHLRVFLAVVDSNSVTRAAETCHVSQPAVTQALAKIERKLGMSLFSRTSTGLFANRHGEAFATRVRRTFELIDPILSGINPRLCITVTTAQLEALIAVHETQNFTLAARRLHLAQPTVHRAITQLEDASGRKLFERTAYGIIATRITVQLAQAARLAFAELEQAEADVADTISEETGRVVIGGMPLSRSYILPKAIAKFRVLRPKTLIKIVEGPYVDLLSALRRGEIDFLIGALRFPTPIDDVEQQVLFTDTLALIAGSEHPLMRQSTITVQDLARYPWIVGNRETPIRQHFDRLFENADCAPDSLIESSSLVLMRELLLSTEHLGCISYLQAQAELARGFLKQLPLDLSHTERPIGLTTRKNWMPTAAQQQFIDLVAAHQS